VEIAEESLLCSPRKTLFDDSAKPQESVKTIRFDDLGKPMQDWILALQNDGRVTDDEINFFLEYVAVREVAKIFEYMGQGKTPFDIWRLLHGQVEARAEANRLAEAEGRYWDQKAHTEVAVQADASSSLADAEQPAEGARAQAEGQADAGAAASAEVAAANAENEAPTRAFRSAEAVTAAEPVGEGAGAAEETSKTAAEVEVSAQGFAQADAESMAAAAAPLEAQGLRPPPTGSELGPALEWASAQGLVEVGPVYMDAQFPAHVRTESRQAKDFARAARTKMAPLRSKAPAAPAQRTQQRWNQFRKDLCREEVELAASLHVLEDAWIYSNRAQAQHLSSKNYREREQYWAAAFERVEHP